MSLSVGLYSAWFCFFLMHISSFKSLLQILSIWSWWMLLLYNDFYLFLFHFSYLQVFHCVHFECPAQLDNEVKEGTPGLDHPNQDHSTQHDQQSQPQGFSSQRSSTSSLHTGMWILPCTQTYAYDKNASGTCVIDFVFQHHVLLIVNKIYL